MRITLGGGLSGDRTPEQVAEDTILLLLDGHPLPELLKEREKQRENDTSNLFKPHSDNEKCN